MKRLIPLIIPVCLAITMWGTGFVTAMAEQPKVQIKIAHWGHEKILIYAPLYIAIDGGYFKRRGLDVSLVYSGNDDQVFATVLSGAAQFGVGDPAFTAISREKGGPGKVVAALVGRVANWAVAKDPAITPFTDPAMLNGRRVTSFPSPSTTFTILSDIKDRLKLDRMEIKQMSFGTELAALENGDADLAIMLEPQASLAEARGYNIVWSVADYYGNFALTGITTTDDYIAREPVQVQALITGLQDALTFCAKDPEAASKLLGKSFPTLDPKVVNSATRRMIADKTIPPTAVIDKTAWIKTLTMRQQVGDLKSLDVAEQCLDVSFAEKALAAVAHVGSSAPLSSANASGVDAESPWWSWYSRIADTVGIIGFILIFGTAYNVRRQRRQWKVLQMTHADIGKALAYAFKNHVDSIEEGELLHRLLDTGISRGAIERALSEFCSYGIIERNTVKGRTMYEPALDWITGNAPLFDLWK